MEIHYSCPLGLLKVCVLYLKLLAQQNRCSAATFSRFKKTLRVFRLHYPHNSKKTYAMPFTKAEYEKIIRLKSAKHPEFKCCIVDDRLIPLLLIVLTACVHRSKIF